MKAYFFQFQLLKGREIRLIRWSRGLLDPAGAGFHLTVALNERAVLVENADLLGNGLQFELKLAAPVLDRHKLGNQQRFLDQDPINQVERNQKINAARRA